ncbi:MAG: nickel pincer cofactor biosynthesis protein LarC [Chloroflexi bacterium]|nr:nickel pincer cofactor biosynthesis protein LarC [Chloroflexota bacterium]
MTIAYFDCFAGISGDMILGALVDVGLPLSALQEELKKLHIFGYRLTAQKTQRRGFQGTQVIVSLEGGSEHPRPWQDVHNLIQQSALSPQVKEQGLAIFQRLAAAEAKVHGVSMEEVHFHEVGATDAMIDVVGAAWGLSWLGVENVFASPLPSGGGTIDSAHGSLPIPAPATLELMAMAQAPLRAGTAAGSQDGELVTPTGAAIITTLAAFHRPLMTLEQVGYGAGARDVANFPNLLRLWLGKEISPISELLLLETNIDDMNPELYGYVLESLLAQGANDVWFTPIQMKKNRPAVMLSVLALRQLEAALVETIMRETSTLGVRVREVQRHESQRDRVEFDSSLGPVVVKVKRLGGKAFSVAPEYEDCRRLALEHGLPLQEVYRIVTAEAQARVTPIGPLEDKNL